jgi:hypothetical protein
LERGAQRRAPSQATGLIRRDAFAGEIQQFARPAAGRETYFKFMKTLVLIELNALIFAVSCHA